MILNVYVREQDIELAKRFKEICRREGSMTKVMREFMATYVKAHTNGNPSYPLTGWLEDPKLVAWPALGGDWAKVKLKEYSKEDLDKMEAKAIEVKRRIVEEWRRRWCEG